MGSRPLQRALRRGDDPRRRRVDLRFERRGGGIGDESGGHPLDRRGELAEQLGLQDRRHLRPGTGELHRVVDDHRASGSAYRVDDGLDVERHQRPQIDDLGAYQFQLSARLDPSAGLFQMVNNAVRAKPKRVVFAEGEDEAVIRAAFAFQNSGLGKALLVGRADVVRLLPQTASFYHLVGLDVNLRGLLFKDVKVTTETVEGKPVLVIEGVIVGESKKTVDLPRLRFSVRDAQGAEIYAWNTVLEQTRLKPGDHAFFKSRLASPPAEGRSIDVRFFNKRDIAGGSV